MVQREVGEELPDEHRVLAQGVAQCRQQAGDHHPDAGAGEHQRAQPGPTAFRGEALAEGGDHDQDPGAGHAKTEAQQRVRPEALGPDRGQGQAEAGP